LPGEAEGDCGAEGGNGKSSEHPEDRGGAGNADKAVAHAAAEGNGGAGNKGSGVESTGDAG
jgi:hypothetical protein